MASPKRARRRKMCYVSKGVNNKFTSLPVSDPERKLIRAVILSAPPGLHSYTYPADGTTINGKTYTFKYRVEPDGWSRLVLDVSENSGRWFLRLKRIAVIVGALFKSMLS